MFAGSASPAGRFLPAGFPPFHKRSPRRPRHGFTLIELLVVMSIMSMLMTILLPALSQARVMARATSVMAAARQMGIAQAIYAESSNGVFIYEQNLVSPMGPTFDVDGKDITNGFGGPGRWPLPFATVVGKEFHKGALYIGDGIEMLPGGKWYSDSTTFGGQYSRSLFPSFGLNSQFVGGTKVSPTSGERSQLVQRPDVEAMQPSKLISMVKARGFAGTDWASGLGLGTGMMEPDGFFYVRPSRGNTGVAIWPTTPFKESDMGSTWGNVDFRYNSAGVPLFCDGHAELLSIDGMRDMRLWSDQARRADNPNYTWTW